MKIKLILLFVLISHYCFSQELKKEIIITKAAKIQDYGFSENGNFYFVAKDKRLNSKEKIVTLSVYDKDTAEKVFSYNPKGNFKIRNVSPSGNNFIYDFSKGLSNAKYKLLNSNGAVKSVTGSIEGNLYKEDSKFGLFDDDLRLNFIEFLTDSAYYVIAPKKKDANQKFILKRPFNFDTPNYVKFDPPLLKTKKEPLYWSLNKIFSDNFVFLAKDLESNKEDNYNIAFFNNDNELNKIISLKVILPDNYFCYSNDGKGTSWYHYTYTIKGQIKRNVNASSGATGNLYVDEKNKVFYTYGLYTGDEKSDRNIEPSGFYIYKFDFNGKLLWKQVRNVKNKTGFNNRQKAFSFIVKFYKIGDSNIGLFLNPSEGKTFHLVNLNASNGTIVKEDSLEFDYFNVSGLGSPKFVSRYILKNVYSNKLLFDYDSIAAAFFNKEFHEYLVSNKNNKNRINFISKIHDSGIVVLQENKKEVNYQLMKFGW